MAGTTFCHGGMARAGQFTKQSMPLVIWSVLLVAFFEKRMKEQASELTQDARRLLRQHEELMHHFQAPVPTLSAAEGKVLLDVDPTLPIETKISADFSDDVSAETSGHAASSRLTGAQQAAVLRGRYNAFQAANASRDTPIGAGNVASRRLMFYETGTTSAHTHCISFSTTPSTYDMNNANCKTTGKICGGCFLALDSGATGKVLNIVKCATFRVTGSVAAANSAPYYTAQLEFINADNDQTLTINSKATSSGSTLSSYILAAENAAFGYCYSGGGNKMYFQNSGLQNAATLDFTSKTITAGTFNTGTFSGATINGNSAISATNIDMNGKTLTLTSATVSGTAAGQIAASYISGGTFKTGETYTFTGSTIAPADVSQGTFTSPTLSGATLTGASFAGTIATSDVTIGAGRTINWANAGTITAGAGKIAATGVGAGTFNAGTYSFTGSTITTLGAANGGTLTGIKIVSSDDITLGTSKTIDLSGGTVTVASGQIASTGIAAGALADGAWKFTGATVSTLSLGPTPAPATPYSIIQGAKIRSSTIGDSSAAGATLTELTATGTADSIQLGSGTFTSPSPAGHIELGNTAVLYGGLGGTGTTSGTHDAQTVSFNAQYGVITSVITNMASCQLKSVTHPVVATDLDQDKITFTNTYIAAGSTVLATAGACSAVYNTDHVTVTGVRVSAGSAVIKLRNLGDTACSAAYKVYFYVINPNPAR